MSSKESDSTYSLKHLGIVFVIFLIFFTIYRWDATQWLRGQIDSAISERSLDVRYAGLELDWMHVQLEDVQIQVPNRLTPLILKKVDISPDWLALLDLRWAALIHVQQALMDLSGSVSVHGDQLEIHDLTAKGDVAAIQAWLAYPLPVQLSGNVRLQGDIDVNIHTSLPLNGNLKLAWNAAALSMMQKEYLLGDYSLDLKIKDQIGVWSVRGGDSVAIQGQGDVTMQASAMTAWPLKGEVKFTAAAKSALAQFLPQSSQKAMISGALGAPHFQLK
ncbi:MAG: type II secretion system protein N [Mariprofundaceae bacterium]|nr:type II secretion system protein N [Mariprofundaceae bacterium]